jgi:Na+-transporting methylmalonyl-CoA/oxaloacetate decarboxylase gamma subunit
METIKAWWEKWKGWVAFAGAFLMFLLAYLMWTMYSRRREDMPTPPTLEAEIKAAQRDVQTESTRQQAEAAAAQKRREAAAAIQEEIRRRQEEADRLAKEGTDKQLEDALREELNKR